MKTVLFKAQLKRNKYFRRFMWMLLGAVAAFGAWIALDEAAGRDIAHADLLTAGRWLALGVVALLILRALSNLWRWLRTKNEQIVILERGFVWNRGRQKYQYSWKQVRTFRQGARHSRLLGKRGAHTLTMQDGEIFAFTHRHGDTDRFAKVVSHLLADISGGAMVRAIRGGKAIKVHPQLAANASGIIAREHKIRWSQVDVTLKGDQLVIARLRPDGSFQPVEHYPVHQVENVAGFLDIAESLMRNHQPKRFNIPVQI